MRAGGNVIRRRGAHNNPRKRIDIHPARSRRHIRLLKIGDFRPVSKARLALNEGMVEYNGEVRQFTPTEYKGGQTLPRITIRTHYHERRLQLVLATYIDHAEFGVHLPNEVFRVAAKPRELLFDYRRPLDKDGGPVYIPLPEGTDDVVETADTYVAPAPLGFQHF